jgi:hypothetical protein
MMADESMSYQFSCYDMGASDDDETSRTTTRQRRQACMATTALESAGIGATNSLYGQ